MGTIERIQAVASRVAKKHQDGHQLVVAVSAMSGETNRLIALAKEIDENPCSREMDVLVSTGEQVTIALLCMALNKIGLEARSYTGGQVRILTDNAHGKARIKEMVGTSLSFRATRRACDQLGCKGSLLISNPCSVI